MDKRRLLIGVVAGIALAVLVIVLTRPATAPSGDIGNAQLRELQASGALLVDVRTPGEFEMGHIPGAVNVPLDELTTVALGWEKSRPVIVYCATGQRSLNASQWLRGNGFASVYNLTSGIVAWDGETTKDSTPVAKYETSGKPVFIDFYSPN